MNEGVPRLPVMEGQGHESSEGKTKFERGKALRDAGFQELFGTSSLDEGQKIEVEAMGNDEFKSIAGEPIEEYGGLKKLFTVYYKDQDGKPWVYEAKDLFEDHAETVIKGARNTMKAASEGRKEYHYGFDEVAVGRQLLLSQNDFRPDHGHDEFVGAYRRAMEPGTFQIFYKPQDHGKDPSARRAGSVFYKSPDGNIYKRTFGDGVSVAQADVLAKSLKEKLSQTPKH